MTHYPGEMNWKGAENLAPTWIRSPEIPAPRDSLCRLSNPHPTDFDDTFHNHLEDTTKTSVLYRSFLKRTHTHTHTYTYHAVKFCWEVNLSLHKFQIRDLLVFGSIETGLLSKSIAKNAYNLHIVGSHFSNYVEIVAIYTTI
jgi:hypothetical protein